MFPLNFQVWAITWSLYMTLVPRDTSSHGYVCGVCVCMYGPKKHLLMGMYTWVCMCVCMYGPKRHLLMGMYQEYPTLH
jgi:hypothetical protein